MYSKNLIVCKDWLGTDLYMHDKHLVLTRPKGNMKRAKVAIKLDAFCKIKWSHPGEGTITGSEDHV